MRNHEFPETGFNDVDGNDLKYSRLFRRPRVKPRMAILKICLLLQVFMAISLPMLAVTDDDNESMIPELYIGFRGTGVGTPTLTANFLAYQLPNYSGGLTNYIESASTNGFTDGVTWTNMSIYVRQGMPLDQSGTLTISCQNVAEYKIFINTPDPKYQAFVGPVEQHLIYWTNTTASANMSTTNIVFFKRTGDNGAEAGKAASAMPGWTNFKLGLGYGKTGNSLGYVTFLYGNQPVLSDSSQELYMDSYTNAGLEHSEIFVTRMAYDMVWNPSYTQTGFNPGAYIINCYDFASQPGILSTDVLGDVYYNFSGYTPVVSYALNYADPSGYTNVTNIKRTEGNVVMNSSANFSQYVRPEEEYEICDPDTVISSCFYNGPCFSITFPGRCWIYVSQSPASGAINTSYDWATNGLSGGNSSQYTEAINYDVGTLLPDLDIKTSIVASGSQIASERTDTSTAYDMFYANNYFWPNRSIQHDAPNTDLPGSSSYYWNPGTGEHLKLQYEVEPSGSWSYYDYYDDIDERGMLKRVTKPYRNGPITAASNAAGALVTDYTYTNNWDRSKTLPLEVTTRLKGLATNNDMIISRSTFDYSASYTNGNPTTPALYQGTLPIWVTEEHDYYGPGVSNYTVTVTKRVRSDVARIFADLPVSIQHPDGTKDVWDYEIGSYNSTNTTFTPEPTNAIVRLYNYATYQTAATRIWKIKCFPSTAPGAQQLTIDPTSYVVPGRSTAEVKVRDQYGRVVITESLVYVGSQSWDPLEIESHFYDPAGNLVLSEKFMDGDSPQDWVPVYEAEYTDVNGGSQNYSSIVFNNSGNATGRKQYERDRSGTIRQFSYDVYGRVTNAITLQAPSPIYFPYPPVATQTAYSYDADNRIVSTTVGAPGNDPNALVSSKTYNNAGLVTQEVKPGGYTTTYSYSQATTGVSAETILDRFNPALNRTITTSHNLDGTVQSEYGSAIIPKYCTNFIQNINGSVTLLDGSTELAGTPVEIVSHGAVGPTLTSRTNVTDLDWLGHTIMQKSANPTSVGNLVTTYTYDNFGHLISTVTGDLAPVLNQYDSYGQLYQSGIKLADGSGSTNLNPSSLDRISQQDTYFYFDGTSWWETTVNSVYPNTNSATPLVVKQTFELRSHFYRVQLPTFPPMAIDKLTKTYDASENETISATLCVRTNDFTYAEQDSTLTGGPSVLYGGDGWSGKAYSVAGKNVYNLKGDGTGEDVLFYNPYGQIAQDAKLLGGTNQATTYTYRSGSSELIYQQNADGTWVQNVYNGAGQLATNLVYNTTSSSPPSSGGKTTCYSYNSRGQVTAIWGNVPFPATNIYYTSAIGGDYNAGLEGELYDQWTFNGGTWTAWPSTLPAANINRYYYFPQNGLLSEKAAIGGSGITNSVQYTYNQRGDILTRTWNRGVVTSYAYNETPGANSGELASVQYSNDPSGVNDPSLSYTYNRMGALASVTDAAGTRSFAYRSSDQQLSSQSLPSGIYGSGLQLGLDYDQLSRVSGYWLGTSAANTPVTASYEYYDNGPTDYSGRIKAIGTPVGTFNYSYLIGTPHISTVGGPTINGNEGFNRNDLYANGITGLLTNSVTSLGATNLVAYSFLYDNLHRLTNFTENGKLYRYYGAGLAQAVAYDDRNEVTNSTTFLTNTAIGVSAAAPLPRRKFGFSFDSNGNRTNTTVDTDAALTYTANQLEQYSSRARPGFIEASGIVNSNSTQVLAFRTGTAFSLTDVGLGNSNAYFYGQSTRSSPSTAGGETLLLSNVLTIAGVKVATNVDTRGILVPPTTQAFSYDVDGNLTNDSLWVYSYDDEDRIKQIQSASTLLTVTNVQPVRLTFTYDFLGRRVQKQVWSYSGGSWSVADTIVYAYSGLNLIAEYQKSGSTLTLDKSYYWGLDNSSSLQGAGGVGGLLGVVTHSTPTVGKYAAINDSWGNVVGLLDVNAGIPMAEYEYTPFGESMRAMGIMATNNPWRFSTKYYDKETGLLNFGYRYYSPTVGRFVNRDSKDELGRLEMDAPLLSGGVSIWSYIGTLVGVPGQDPALSPSTSMGLAQSNEREDGNYRNSAEPGDLFNHRKSNPSQGGGASQGDPSAGIPSAPDFNHPYGFVNNNPYQGIDPFGLFDWATSGFNPGNWFDSSGAWGNFWGSAASAMPDSSVDRLFSSINVGYPSFGGSAVANYDPLNIPNASSWSPTSDDLYDLNELMNPLVWAEERAGEVVDGRSYQESNSGEQLSTSSRIGSWYLGQVDLGIGVLQALGLGSAVSEILGTTTSTGTATGSQLVGNLPNANDGDVWRTVVYNSANQQIWVGGDQDIFHLQVLNDATENGGWRLTGDSVNGQYVGGNARFIDGQFIDFNTASGHLPGTPELQAEAQAAALTIMGR